jgi:hypothetical protein
MDQKGPSAIRFIAVFGIGIFVLLWAVSVMLRQAVQPAATQLVEVTESRSPFDQKRAWADLEHIVGLGPRPAGSEAAAALRDHLRGELLTAGLAVREQAVEAAGPEGPVRLVNLFAECRGDLDGIIVLAGPYDTRHVDGFPLVGANGGGAATAWLLEMARALGPERKGCSVWLVWLDGGELPDGAGPENGPPGGRAFADHLRDLGVFDRVAAAITVEMIGDAYLDIRRDPDAPRWLGNTVWRTALRLGYGGHFLHQERPAEGSILAFRGAGLPALAVADLSYGGTPTSDQRLRHTAEDTLERVRAESLKAVGDVLYHALNAVDADWKRQRPPGVR